MVARTCLSLGLFIGILLLAALPASAQAPATVTPSQADCQTIVRCNFRRGGDYRGCISAYSCRRCRLVRSRICDRRSDDRRRVCRRVVCTWG